MNNEPMIPKPFRVGDLVSFGRAHGEKTRGKVVRVSRKSLSIETIEERGNGRGAAVGKMWRVHPSLVQAVSQDESCPTPTWFDRTSHSPILRSDMDKAKSDFVEVALAFGLNAPVTVAAFDRFKAALASVS